jgi:hypothetical protein
MTSLQGLESLQAVGHLIQALGSRSEGTAGSGTLLARTSTCSTTPVAV